MAKILLRNHIYQATTRLISAPELAQPLTVANFKNGRTDVAVTARSNMRPPNSIPIRGFSTTKSCTSDQIQKKNSFTPSVVNPCLDLCFNIFKPYAYKCEDQSERGEISEVAVKSKIVAANLLPHQVIHYGHWGNFGQVAGLRWNAMNENICVKQGHIRNCLGGPVKTFTRGLHQDVKLRKQQKGCMKGISSRGDHICFGTYALQALGPARITCRQLEAGRKMLKWCAGKSARIWGRVFPDHSITTRSIGTRMGRGKGPLGAENDRVAIVKPGRILFEMSGVTQEIAKRAILLGAHKMPVRTQFKITAPSLSIPLSEMRWIWKSKKRDERIRKAEEAEVLDVYTTLLEAPTWLFTCFGDLLTAEVVPTSEDCEVI